MFNSSNKNKTTSCYDNRKKLMKFNRFFSDFKVFTTVYMIWAILALIILIWFFNALDNFDFNSIINGEEANKEKVTIFETIKNIKFFFVLYCVFVVILYGRFAYGIRVSFGDLNVGQKGTAEWVDHDKLGDEYPVIPEKVTPFSGIGGIPVARDGDNLFCDKTNVNSLIIGGTRSGKGQALIEPMVEILSRAEDKCSMVVTDPKMELSNKMVPELVRRGYETHVLNLVDPQYSMGFNPLHLIIEEYKDGKVETAQQLAASLGYTVFQKNDQEKDPFFTDSARNIFIAAIYADIEDNIKKDIEDNKRWLRLHNKNEKERERRYYQELYSDEYDYYILKRYIDKIMEKEPLSIGGLVFELKIAKNRGDLTVDLDINLDNVKYVLNDFEYKTSLFIPKPYYPSRENEKKINLFSIISMCNYLSSVKVGRERTALDEYFDKRDEDDFARITYGSIIQASEGTKGNVMATFRGKVTIFSYDSIAKMTAESTLEFMQLGFGKKPVAIFIALPDYDNSNHFLASVFINQMYFVLAKLATAMPSGKLPRRVSFILDEFGNLPALDNFSNIVTVCLGRNILFTLAIQSTAQLQSKYDDGSKTIKGNCGNWFYLMTQDNETAEEISKILGNRTIVTLNRTGKKLGISKEFTEMHEEEPLMRPDELMKLRMGEIIVIRGMYREAKGKAEGEKIKALPIANLGENRMKFAYEFLSDVFPQNQLLYRSDNLDKILKRNKHINIGDLNIAEGYIENTNNINLKSRTRSGKNWVEHNQYMSEPALPSHEKRTGTNRELVNKIFDLLNLNIQERKIYEEAGSVITDDLGQNEILHPEYVINNQMLYDYAYELFETQNPTFIEKGYELLDIILPLPKKSITNEELQDKGKIDAEILALKNKGEHI